MRGSALVAGLWMLVLSLWGQPSQAELQEAHLSLRGTVLELHPPPLWDGRELWLPLQHLPNLGIETQRQGDHLRLLALPPDSPASRLPLSEKRRTSDTPPELCVPVRDLIRRIGGYTRWDEATRTLTLLAYIRSARLLPDIAQVEVETSFPVHWRVFSLNDPPRLVIDLVGCALPDNPPRLEEGAHPELKATRLAQFDPQTVRIVLELSTPIVHQAEGVSHRWQVGFLKPSEPQQVATAEAPNAPAEPTPPAEEPSPQSPEPAVPLFQMPSLQRTAQGVQIQLPLTQGVTPRMRFLEDPLSVVLEVPGTLQDAFELSVVEEGLFVRAMRALPVGQGMVQLVLELNRVVSAHLLPGKETLTLNLRPPRGSGGTLKQKIVVIDPGHGGSQAGARWGQGKEAILEKDITLSIGLKVAERLAREGASVIMTRAEDKTLGLYERTAMANQSNAHFFISIHCDSNPRPNSVSGTTIYYHKEDADSRALGQAILREIAKVSGLPSKGVRSDTTLYQNGLAVLRTSQMPAVLIEVGYLNHSFDRSKLVDPKFQERVAEAIVRGLKRYVEGGL